MHIHKVLCKDALFCHYIKTKPAGTKRKIHVWNILRKGIKISTCPQAHWVLWLFLLHFHGDTKGKCRKVLSWAVRRVTRSASPLGTAHCSASTATHQGHTRGHTWTQGLLQFPPQPLKCLHQLPPFPVRKTQNTSALPLGLPPHTCALPFIKYSFFKCISHCGFVFTGGTLSRLLHLSRVGMIRHSCLGTPAMQELQGWSFHAAHDAHRACIRQLWAHSRAALGSRVLCQPAGPWLSPGAPGVQANPDPAQSKSQEGSRPWRGTTTAPTYDRTQCCFTRLFPKKECKRNWKIKDRAERTVK